MRRLTLTLAMLGILALSAFAVTGHASAHENCIHTTEHGWQLTGCVSDDGSVVWTAVDPSDKFYRWVNGKWQEQERPPVPEPVVLPPLRSDVPATLGIPASGSRDSGRIVYQHEAHSGYGSESEDTEVQVRGATGNRRFPLGELSLHCKYPGTQMAIYVSVVLRTPGRVFPAWLNRDEDAKVSFSTRPYRWQDVEFDVYGKVISISSSVGENTRWITHNEAQDFFRELMKHDQLAVRLPGIDGPIVVTFDLDGVFETPVQHLLERCLGE